MKTFESIPSSYRMNSLISDFVIKSFTVETTVPSCSSDLHGIKIIRQKLNERKRFAEEYSECPSKRKFFSLCSEKKTRSSM